jgi:hypothetical protein
MRASNNFIAINAILVVTMQGIIRRRRKGADAAGGPARSCHCPCRRPEIPSPTNRRWQAGLEGSGRP